MLRNKAFKPTPIAALIKMHRDSLSCLTYKPGKFWLRITIQPLFPETKHILEPYPVADLSPVAFPATLLHEG